MKPRWSKGGPRPETGPKRYQDGPGMGQDAIQELSGQVGGRVRCPFQNICLCLKLLAQISLMKARESSRELKKAMEGLGVFHKALYICFCFWVRKGKYPALSHANLGHL